MERSFGTFELKKIIQAIDKAALKAGVKSLRIILCGGLAAIAYGMEERVYFVTFLVSLPRLNLW